MTCPESDEYCFKPICYGMIVAILNYHSSIITIMAKGKRLRDATIVLQTRVFSFVIKKR